MNIQTDKRYQKGAISIGSTIHIDFFYVAFRVEEKMRFLFLREKGCVGGNVMLAKERESKPKICFFGHVVDDDALDIGERKVSGGFFLVGQIMEKVTF